MLAVLNAFLLLGAVGLCAYLETVEGAIYVGLAALGYFYVLFQHTPAMITVRRWLNKA